MLARELQFFMVRVADHTERYADVLTSMNAIIGTDSALNDDERNLLSVAYKALTGSRRSALRTVNAFLDDDSIKAIPEHVAKLSEFKAKLLKELDAYCYGFIQLVDSKLLPAADVPMKIFCEKLQGDYYRHSVEFNADDARLARVEKASQESAMQMARAYLTKDDDLAYLGVALNDSVFLYEIIGQKQEAIDLAAGEGEIDAVQRGDPTKLLADIPHFHRTGLLRH
jgi:14-3-3 protein epsilon